MRKIVVLTGAGISAESGLKTFRDSDGLWEGYQIEEVATPGAWHRNPELVQKFYNERRKAVIEAEPNAAHKALKRLEEYFNTIIITQNIDDLHERGGSSNIIHLHGMIRKSQSSVNPQLLYEIEGWELKMNTFCELGSQLRPHVVWFGEPVPMIEKAIKEVQQSDIVILIGTSLKVYPATSLMEFASGDTKISFIDPKKPDHLTEKVNWIEARAVEGVPKLIQVLIDQEIQSDNK